MALIREYNTLQKFGILTIIYRDKENNRYAHYRCECGREVRARIQSVKEGRKTSCGCKNKNIKHGLSRTHWYNRWMGIQQRCYNPNHSGYMNYGGRGIKCEWGSIEEFYNDMKYGYRKGRSIDRIDNNGNYNKENCRWATPKTQANNTRINNKITRHIKEVVKKIGLYTNPRMIYYNGDYRHLKDVGYELGIGYRKITSRIDRLGQTKEEALRIVPVRSPHLR